MVYSSWCTHWVPQSCSVLLACVRMHLHLLLHMYAASLGVLHHGTLVSSLTWHCLRSARAQVHSDWMSNSLGLMILLCLQELTLTHPNVVNAKKNTELTYGKGTFLSNHQ